MTVPAVPASGRSDDAERVRVVDLLRGFAAVSVTWYHLTGGGKFLPHLPVLARLSHYSYLGLDVFFVISGFVLPWSLYRANYRLRSYGSFLLRRVVRIDPPYLCVIVLTLILGYLSSHTPGFAGAQPFIGWAAVFGHIAFLNAFTGQPWLSPVFWTLAIEFQYYVLIGLIFPLVVSSSRVVRACVAMAFLIAPHIVRRDTWLPGEACVFLLGIVTFQFRSGLLPKGQYFATLAVATLDLGYVLGPAIAVASLSAALLIAYADRLRLPLQSRFLLWLGSISYSLYLIHVPIGGRVVNLAHRMPQTWWMQSAEAIAALCASLVAAAVLYRLVEKPSREFASRVGR